jgi:hypothetical protein
MSNQYPGGLITKSPVVPNSIVAPGIWTLSQQAAAQATNTWPFPRDPYFKNVTMLLHGDGSAQSLPTTGVGAGASAVVTPFNADASTNNFNVTINGDARSNNFTPYQGNGYYSNAFATSAGVQFPYTSSLTSWWTQDFTMEMWVFNNTNAVSGTNSLPLQFAHGNYGAASTFWAFGTNALGQVEFYYYNGAANYVTGTSAASLGTWNHIAMVYTNSSGNISLYLNGVSVASATKSGTPQNFSGNTVNIGAVQATYYNGYVSNLRVLNGTALYTGTFTPSTTPLTAITNTQLLTCQSNRFVDNSTNNATPTLIGSPQVAPAQPFTLPSSVATYGSGYFDGTGDYLTVADNAALELLASDFTIECWVYPTGGSGSVRDMISKRSAGANYGGYSLYLDASNNCGFVADNDTSAPWPVAITGTAVSLGQWTHLAVTRSGSTWTLWRNGVSAGTATSSITINDASTSVGIGAIANGDQPLTGYITDARIVKGTALYSTTFTPPTSPLTAITNTSLLTTQYNGGGNNNGFKDSSQNNFVITRAGNTTQGTFTPYGADWSNYFNGSSDYLTMPDNANYVISGDFTVEAWIYPTSFAGTNGNIVLAQWPGGTASNQSFQFYVNSTGKVGLVYGIGATNAAVVGTSLSCTLNTWNHIAVTRSGTTVRYFVNGALDATSSTVSGAFNNSTGVMSVGRINASDSGYFSGYISNCRLVIGTALYTTAFTPSITPITAVSGTQVLVCQSNRFLDNSSNAAAITVAGTPSVQSFSPFVPLVVYNPAVNGGSVYFDGSGDYLDAPSNTAFGYGTRDFTIEFWVYPTSSSGTQVFIDQRAGTATSAVPTIYTSSGTIYYYVSGSNRITGSSLSLNQWFHIAICRSGTSTKLFINGTQSGSTFTDTTTYLSSPVRVGEANDGTSFAPYLGYLSNCRIVNGSALYTTTFTPPTAPLTAISGTSLLLSNTNAGIFDNAMINNLQTVGNAQITTSVVKYGTASVYLDGTNSILTTYKKYPLGQGTGDFTIEFWFRPATIKLQTILSMLTTTTSVNPHIFMDASGFVNYYTAGSTRISGSIALSNNTWYFITVCRASGTTRLFINGTQSGSNYSDSNSYVTPAYVNMGQYMLSDGTFYTGEWCHGYFDDVRLSNYARYTTTFTPPTEAFPNG